MVKIFNTRNEFLLAIVPEGTRKKVPTIKTGFWHIARAAKVSIICWYLDNENKTARWLAEIIPGEDKIEDLIRIRDLYERAGYRFPLDVTLSSPGNSSGR
jgi:1-acyl-sn-glycerol-3-phosphate acyltransferase